MSGIEIHTSHNPFQWLFLFFAPKCSVNGQEYPLVWGTRTAPFPPGHYHLKVWVPYLFGPTCMGETTVTVQEGHVTSVRYETPFMVFMQATCMVTGMRPAQ
jgi:hypothetical protein